MGTKTQGRMKCHYCNAALSSLRSLTDGEFCSDEHRHAFERGERSPAEPVVAQDTVLQSRNIPVPQEVGSGIQHLNAFDFQSSAVAPKQNALLQAQTESDGPLAWQPDAGHIPAWSLGSDSTVESRENLEAVEAHSDFAQETDSPQKPQASPSHPSYEVLGSWRWLSTAWNKAPRDLKILLVVLPVLVALAVGPSVPKVTVKLSNPTANNVQQIVVTQWKDLQQSISNRAAIAFSDDFRSGLDAWQSRSNLTRSWSYDASGFVRPGPLAIFKPTTELSDYRFEFLEEIDQKGMGAAFRASDLDNYYAAKLVVVRPGPLPLVHLVRYAVIHGKETAHVEKPLPFTTRADTLYRVLVDVRGSDFTIMVQGQVVDFWSDTRLSQGGIGFFCSRGERARLRWVEVSHQYDALGRLCAYLAPYGIDGKNGSLN